MAFTSGRFAGAAQRAHPVMPAAVSTPFRFGIVDPGALGAAPGAPHRLAPPARHAEAFSGPGLVNFSSGIGDY